MSAQTTLLEDLNTLHSAYVEAINMAVAEDDPKRIHQLAAAYDADATWMVAEREGKTHLLPLVGPRHRR